MRLVLAVLLAVLGFVTCDDQLAHNYYQQSGHNKYQDSYSGYSTGQHATAPYYSTADRRQGTVDILGRLLAGLSVRELLIAKMVLALALGGLALIGAVVYFGASLTGSGRGMDTDEWEIDHSLWMDQLQQDFEDSWST